MTNLLILN